jgi:hypothetical protein
MRVWFPFAPEYRGMATRSRATGLIRLAAISYGLTLNTPPMTAAKKITMATKSNPVTIFLFSVTPGNRRRGSNLEDRIHPTLSASGRKAISSA